MKIDRATLLASIALGISLISLGLQLMPQNMVPSPFGSETHMWRKIASYEGTENTTTASFYVPSYLWIVIWNATWTDKTKEGEFSAIIYSPGAVEKAMWSSLWSFGGYFTTYGSQRSTGSESFYGSGKEFFYFKVEAWNVFWQIYVYAWS